MAGKKKTASKNNSKPVRRGNEWEKFPPMLHLAGAARENLERRRRHRHVRYWCFRMQTLVTTDRPLEGAELMPGFVEFWLEQKPLYLIDPRGNKVESPEHQKKKMVHDLGGYATFAELWDVDADLEVYLRHSSIHHEWNLTLMRVVPVLGEH